MFGVYHCVCERRSLSCDRLGYWSREHSVELCSFVFTAVSHVSGSAFWDVPGTRVYVYGEVYCKTSMYGSWQSKHGRVEVVFRAARLWIASHESRYSRHRRRLREMSAYVRHFSNEIRIAGSNKQRYPDWRNMRIPRSVFIYHLLYLVLYGWCLCMDFQRLIHWIRELIILCVFSLLCFQT